MNIFLLYVICLLANKTKKLELMDRGKSLRVIVCSFSIVSLNQTNKNI